MNNPGMKWRVGALLLLVTVAAQAQPVPEEARKHMVRGATALQMAKSPDEFGYAVKEFEQATRLAPEWPVAWFNLGTVQEKTGDIPGSLVSLKRYLELAPNAEDAQQVRDKVIALEYMQERAQQAANLTGQWGDHYVSVKGDQFTAVGKTQHYNFIDVFFSGDVQQGARYPALDDRFEGTIHGNTITGTVTRATFVEGKSECQIPEERADFTGKVNEEGTSITLKYERAHYRADWNGIFWGLESCTSVTRNGSTPVTQVLARPKPAEAAPSGTQDPVAPRRGIVGLQVKQDEAGGVVIAAVIPGRSADRTGIKVGDHIQAVDGVDVSGLPLEEVVKRVGGEAGTTVMLKVQRGGEMFVYTLNRESFEMQE